MGGIGNQLFIVAAAYAYSKKYNKNLLIDTSNWSGGPGSKHIDTYLSTIFKKFNNCNNIIHGDSSTIIQEVEFNYNKPEYHEGSVEFSGYFQSLKYFDEYKKEFLAELILPDIYTTFPINKNSVAFHIRRGDYLNYPDIFNVCDDNYFKKMFDQFDGYDINVFTDSPEVISNNFKDYKYRLIQTQSELIDMKLISNHTNIVCSNSSFSWWSSFLGDVKTLVVVPSIWLRDRDCSDIYRNDMTKTLI
jgi:hypothetical protein